MKKIENYLYLILGLFLATISFNLFLAPYNLVSGGVSGPSLIIHKLIHMNESVFILITNSLLLLLSFLLLGKEMTRKTILGSLLFPVFITLTKILNSFIPTNDLDLIIIAVLGGIISGTGYGLIFKSGFTSGGTDILNQIIENYFHIPISTSILFVDGIITVLGGLIFGIPTMVYALIALVFISLFSNKKIIGIGESKALYIYTTKKEEIKKYLHQELKVDSTDFLSTGGYTNQVSQVIMTVIKTKDYYKTKEIITSIDKNAFLVVTDAYELVNENLQIQKQ